MWQTIPCPLKCPCSADFKYQYNALSKTRSLKKHCPNSYCANSFPSFADISKYPKALLKSNAVPNPLWQQTPIAYALEGTEAIYEVWISLSIEKVND